MKKKLIIAVLGILFMVSMMFAEYRYIMHNIRPYYSDNGVIYLEVFGNVDGYYAENMGNFERLVNIKEA